MVQDAQKVRTLEELKGHTLEDLLHEVARSREAVTVILDEEDAVVIRPVEPLKPLPALEGHVPEGWKDAIY